MTHKSVHIPVLCKDLVESRYWSEKNNSIHCHDTREKKLSTCAFQEIYCWEKTTYHRQRREPMSLYHHKRLAYMGFMSQSKRLTSLTPTPTYVHNSPFSATIPARTDLHFKFVFGDADCLESRFEYIVVSWCIPQRGNTLKVIQKATSTISSKLARGG